MNDNKVYLDKSKCDVYDSLQIVEGSMGQRVTDVIGKDYLKWKNDKPVFIDAGTGTGKNYFILNTLLADAYKDNNNVLLLVNRTALSVQQQDALCKKISIMMPDFKCNRTSFSELDGKPKKVGNVILASYQSIVSSLKEDNMSAYFKEELKKVKYMVFDECDFFMSDSEFNEYVSSILKVCVKKMHDTSIRVYMSATMDQVFKKLYDLEKEYQKNNITWNEQWENYKERNLGIYYYIQPDYRNYNFYFFRDLKEITALMKVKSKEKFLVFVTSRKDGQELEKNLKASESVAFVCSENKYKTEVFKKICSEESFSERILISTKILDRGVNLSTEGDNGVTNIVVGKFFDEYEIKQMVGRLRNDGKRTINVFLQEVTADVIEKLEARLNAKCKAASSFKKIFLLKEQVRYLDRYNVPFREEGKTFIVDDFFFCKIEHDLNKIKAYRNSIEDKKSKSLLPISYNKYKLIKNGQLKAVYEYGINKIYYDDLTMYNSYNEIMLSWFSKEHKVEYLDCLKNDKNEKWEEVLSEYVLQDEYDSEKYKNKNNFYNSDGIRGKCDSKNGTILLALGNKIKMNKLCKEEILFSKSGEVIDYIKNAILEYDLKFKIGKDKAKIDFSKKSRVEIYYIVRS